MAGSGRVAEAMLRAPKTLPAHASVGDVRALLLNDHVHMALLVSGSRLVGTVTRADLEAADALDPAVPAVVIARLEGRTVGPLDPLEAVRSHLVATGQRRLAVVDRAGTLLGLLCLKRTG
ncbi:CBS domain-containing protein, partial [uncultured Nocardioides sp.]|uniref:CBS domain-containing protein n=1 Tax=uncultured Nocardioides sp. TaxID=198441 RepID=UPI0030FB5816